MESSTEPRGRTPSAGGPLPRPMPTARPGALRRVNSDESNESPFGTVHKPLDHSESPHTNGHTTTDSPLKNGIPNGFPFDAAPGTVAPTPTTDVAPPVNSNDTNTTTTTTPARRITTAEVKEQLGETTSFPSSDTPTQAKGFSGGELESTTPTGRRSVQFARPNTIDYAGPSHSRRPSQPDITEEGEDKDKDKDEAEGKDTQTTRLLNKLKALASPMSLHGHSKSFSGWTMGESSQHHERSSSNDERGVDYAERESDADADAEDSAPEDATNSSRRPKLRTRRPADRSDGNNTAPTTPRTTKISTPWSRDRDSPGDTPTTARAHGFFRRATMADIPENQRQHVSEDEGRARLATQGVFRRGTSWVPGRHLQDVNRDPNRPSNFRRLTAIPGLDETPFRRQRGERHHSMGGMRWRQIKAGLKMLGTKKKEDRIDSTKSAELLAELLAGAPAALFLASMFQRDDRGHRRIPVLLEQLKLRIVDSQRIEYKTGDRHVTFRIELEYGSGVTRMKWVINRTLRDFANLHLKYKIQSQTDRYIAMRSDDKGQNRLPRFPKSAFPYLRGVRGFADDEEDDDEELMPPEGGTDAEASGTDRPGKRSLNRRQSSFPFTRRKSSISNGPPTPSGPVDALHPRPGSIAGGARRETYAERQRRRLEQYLQAMVTNFMFRPDGNRLCKFLELSALGVRLSAEGGYHGKEGYMVIASSRGLDFRKTFRPHHFKERHTPKWFLVRHSYIVCVDSPEEMNVYDVFLVDSQFTTEKKDPKRKRDETAHELARRAKEKTKYPTHHQLRIFSAERQVKLLARTERQLHQFEESINFMRENTPWAQEHRFGSFAPVRRNVFAQWLVDGRDYMWNVSRAISMAKDVIYIHDWWLSPELYLRRPAAISQKWRLDRLLQRKAQEGVKVFVIVYRNINSAIPIDSEYTKFSLLDLHPNVFVQRSPNQFRQNTFFWSHHEKICIVDHLVAFCGGVDLCFGRWDTPGHSVVDDKLTGFELNDMPKDADHCQLWPGKDYSNPRVQDFYALDKPYEEMYDRGKIPRMPWHDIGMQIVGQPARDLTRHFIQRWNYILRQRKPSRPTPFLLPPRDFLPGELEDLGLEGTCEIQILRSAGDWSLGLNRTENSIENAYVKMIETSEHFMYMENQFFITSCVIEGTVVENRIGDAIVERIKRAHANDEDWRAIIIIPLMPGYQNTVDSPEGSSVRLIMQCQYRSICRGETSIFGKLRTAGIEPEDYIQFYALRSWGKIGPEQSLVTEQLYIHAKAMVVDDRVAIIGSANINERSMRGNRDSEVAAVIRDRHLVQSTMAGAPYMVGRFPYTMRMRLMREHLGIDTDEITEREIAEEHLARAEERRRRADDEVSLASQPYDTDGAEPSERWRSMEDVRSTHRPGPRPVVSETDEMHSFNGDIDWEQGNNPNLRAPFKKLTTDPRIMGNEAHARDVRGEGTDRLHEVAVNTPEILAARDSYIDAAGREVLVSDVAAEQASPGRKLKRKQPTRAHRESTASRESRSARVEDADRVLPPTPVPGVLHDLEPSLPTVATLPALPVTDDTDIGGPALNRTLSTGSAEILFPLLHDLKRPLITEDCMRDPLNDSFFHDIWHAVAEDNTKLFRQVFRCMPDNQVKTWKEYQEYTAFGERFAHAQGLGKSKQRMQQERRERTGGPVGNVPGSVPTAGGLHHLAEKAVSKLEHKPDPLSEKAAAAAPGSPSLRTSRSRGSRGSPPLGTVGEWGGEERVASSRATDRGVESSAVDEKEAMKAEAEGPVTEEPKVQRDRTVTISGTPTPGRAAAAAGKGSTRRRRRGATRSSTRAFHANEEMLEKGAAEELLRHVQGHLVVWPYDWLEREEKGGGWLYATDQIAPLEIYT